MTAPYNLKLVWPDGEVWGADDAEALLLRFTTLAWNVQHTGGTVTGARTLMATRAETWTGLVVDNDPTVDDLAFLRHLDALGFLRLEVVATPEG